MRLRLVLAVTLAAGLLAVSGCRDFGLRDGGVDPPDDGLLLHYSFDFDRGARVVDETGRGGDATLHGGARWVRDGIRRGAIAFDGEAGSFVEDPDGGAALNGLNAVTLSVWVRSDTTGTDAGVFICAPPDGRDRSFSLRYDAEGAQTGGRNSIKGGVTTPNRPRGNSFESAPNVQTTDWQHLVMTWASGRGFELYLDGRPSALLFNANVEGVLDGMSTLLVGKGSKDLNSSWRGLIDEVLIYDRVLEPEEVRALYAVAQP